MAISVADIETARALGATLPPSDTMQPLTTIASVFAFLATAARAEGRSEADDVELVARLADCTADELRGAERTLRKLGYRDVCYMLRRIAGRRKHSLAPLS
jgi:hypothetical protein